uniref:Cuticle protein n=2 Tax=Musca domestica TaxID=7370 RepID=A0A1I8MMZ8_MUSDO
MLKYLLLSLLLTIHSVWMAPVHHHGELTPHVVIVTPQAQLQLESFPHGAPIIQHLTPYTRFVAPHEETIVYVPTSAIANHPVGHIALPGSQQYEARSSGKNIITDIVSIPSEAVDNFGAVGSISPSRIISSTIAGAAALPGQIFDAVSSPAKIIGSIASPIPLQIIDATKLGPPTRQSIFDNISNAVQNPNQVIETITNAANNPSSLLETVSNSIQNAVTNAVQNSPCESLNSIAQNTGFQPTPNQQQAASNARSIDKAETQAEGQNQDQKTAASQPQLTKVQHIEYEIPITPIISHEPRHQLPHYASVIGPALPHVVDFIQTPIFLAPSIPTIKGRSLLAAEEKPISQEPAQAPAIESAKPEGQLPLAPQPENLPLNPELDKLQPIAKGEEKLESGRFLEATPVKDVQAVVVAEEAVKPVDQIDAVKPVLKSVVNDEPQSKVA